jgi:hypothetical protein
VSEVQATQQQYPGVYLQKPKTSFPRWIGRVYLNGKRTAVPGRYDTAQEACDARVAFMAAHGIASKAA